MTNQTRMTNQELTDRAIRIMRDNDRGGFTVPTAGLYPFQWNWDSAFAALGFANFDLDRAWQELESLMSGQWSNGMVPHIIFRRDEPTYFPGPGVWQTPSDPASSGITQPPIAAIVARQLNARQPEAEDRCRSLFPKLLAWHRWFHTYREPQQDGVITVTHPWEVRDNAADWDEPMANINTDHVGEYKRKDLSHVDSDMRPKKRDYDCYLAMVYFGRDHNWGQEEITKNGPFIVADPGLSFMLLRANRELLALAELLGETQAAEELTVWIQRAEAGLGRLWSEGAGAYCAIDLKTGKQFAGVSSSTFLSFYAGVNSAAQMQRQLEHLRRFAQHTRYGVPSLDPEHPRFESLRYWLGPIWAVVNYMIGTGLAEQGENEMAQRIRQDTLELIANAGFYEYFCPLSGRGAGGDNFTWTAAIWLEWVRSAGKSG